MFWRDISRRAIIFPRVRRPHGLAVRTLPFHGSSQGSIPCGVANLFCAAFRHHCRLRITGSCRSRIALRGHGSSIALCHEPVGKAPLPTGEPLGTTPTGAPTQLGAPGGPPRCGRRRRIVAALLLLRCPQAGPLSPARSTAGGGFPPLTPPRPCPCPPCSRGCARSSCR